MFVDKARIQIIAGSGGDGKISFIQEKYISNGGPDGGDGGKGGDVVFVVDDGMRTLMDFRYKRKHKAEDGNAGGPSLCYGRSADDLIIRVPEGTIIRETESGLLVGDLKFPGDKVIVAKGGRGGKGNAHFKSSTRQAPHFAQPGEKGEEISVELELKLIADIGLVGFPNVGKSTFLSIVTAARPKIANYHFTTLVPNLGVVDLGDGRSFVMADLPGLIEGAHEGVGLGHDFLRHVERTKVLIHILDISGIEGRDAIDDFDKINEELKLYSEKLTKKPQVVACNKTDLLLTDDEYKAIESKLNARGYEVFPISAATKKGIEPLLNKVYNMLEQVKDLEKSVEEVPELMYHRNMDTRPYTIREESGVYIVEGPFVERLLASVNINDSDSIKYFQKVIRKRGIIDELRKMGVQDGDTVSMGEIEFEFYN